MSDASYTEDLRKRIKGFKDTQREAAMVRDNLRSAENQLALVTAEAYVVISYQGFATAHGASKEVESKAHSLTISFQEGMINISHSFDNGKFTGYLGPGGKLVFKIEEDLQEVVRFLEIYAFATLAEADDKVLQLRQNRSSR